MKNKTSKTPVSVCALTALTLAACNPEVPSAPHGETASSVSGAQTISAYQRTELDFLPYAINDDGHVAGIRGTFPAEREAVIWRDGVVTSLGPVGTGGQVTGLNRHGVVVGHGAVAGTSRGFLWNGAMHDLGPDFLPLAINDTGEMVGTVHEVPVFRSGSTTTELPCTPAFPRAGLNNLGQVVGWVEVDTPDGGIERHVCLWDDGEFRDLGIRGGMGVDINDQTAVVGFAGEELPRAFIWRDGLVTTLPSLGGSASAYAINKAEIVVGASDEHFSTEVDIKQPVVWTNGAVTKLAEEFGQATDINKRGQIIGTIRSDNDQPPRGALWTPSHK